MRAFGVPQVGFGVGAEDFTGVGDEGSDVEEFRFWIYAVASFCWVCLGVRGDYRARYDVDLQFLGESLIFWDILVGGLGDDGELGVFRDPAAQMILW